MEKHKPKAEEEGRGGAEEANTQESAAADSTKERQQGTGWTAKKLNNLAKMDKLHEIYQTKAYYLKNSIKEIHWWVNSTMLKEKYQLCANIRKYRMEK